MAEKRAETQVFLHHLTEKKRRRSDPSLHVSEDATTAPRQRKRKSGTDPVAQWRSYPLVLGSQDPDKNSEFYRTLQRILIEDPVA